MNIRDPQARIFMNFYVDGKDKAAGSSVVGDQLCSGRKNATKP